jgi:anaerobic magnesium-protoporphyrin IX monomethyl ester cyclase
MDVQLVFPYEISEDKPWALPSLGLGYLYSMLKRAGIDCGITDCTFIGLEAGIDRIIQEKPEIVGIYTMVTLGENANFIARRLRGVIPHIVAGGPLATAYPELFLKNFDYCLLGEGEVNIVTFIDRVLKGRDVASIPGVLGRDSKHDPSAGPHVVTDLSAVPHPNRDLFPIDEYKQYWLQNFGYFPASIIATRGCPYNCDFCSRPISGSNFRKRVIDDILAEIDEICRLGYNNFWFADDAISYDTDFFLRLVKGIKEMRGDFQWECLSRTDRIGSAFINSLQESRLRKVYLGLESGSDQTLKLMNKGAKVKDSVEALKLFKQCGIMTHGFFMIGYPGETIEDIWKTVRFSARSDLDEISYTVPYPLPGSKLFERHMAYVDPQKEWSRDRENTVLIDFGFSEKFLKKMIDLAEKAHHIAITNGDQTASDYIDSRRKDIEAVLKDH